MSKQGLLDAGMPRNHMRPSTYQEDMQTGFADVVHLSTDAYPERLHTVLGGGFPHVRLTIPTQRIDEEQLALCRYHLCRGQETMRQSDVDGHVVPPFRIPVATTPFEKKGMLRAYGKGPLEVLVRELLPLSDDTELTVFSLADQTPTVTALKRVGRRWQVRVEDSGTVRYTVGSQVRKHCVDFLNRTATGTNPGPDRPKFE